MAPMPLDSTMDMELLAAGEGQVDESMFAGLIQVKRTGEDAFMLAVDDDHRHLVSSCHAFFGTKADLDKMDADQDLGCDFASFPALCPSPICKDCSFWLAIHCLACF
jgi:hypothetical protein